MSECPENVRLQVRTNSIEMDQVDASIGEESNCLFRSTSRHTRRCQTCKKRLSRPSSHSDSHYDVNSSSGWCRSCEILMSPPSIGNLLGEDIILVDFQTQVTKKSQDLLIGRQEAELEVIIDKLITQHGDKENALLFIIKKFPSETKTQIFINTLLNRGANPSTFDQSRQTPLHHAVKRNFKGVCSKLLENDAHPYLRDSDNNMPYHLALSNNNDEIAALLVKSMPHKVIRDLYIATDQTGVQSECSLHKLLEAKMQETAMGVLDAMIDQQGDSEDVRVYYHTLESDRHGRAPTHPDFQQKDMSCLHVISQEGLKTVVFHDAVRLLIQRKWRKYARFRFQINCMYYCFTLACLTFALAVATLTPDPTQYTDYFQITRGVTEAFACYAVAWTLILECNQFRRHRCNYWKDKFNWIDLASCCLLLAVIPLRWTGQNQQWHIFSVGYFLWTLRMFKYAAIFRKTGAYALILWRIISEDFLQFGMIFLVLLLAFTGSLTLALRGEDSLSVHNETSTYWNIMFVGMRTLVEAYAVVEYSGENGYPPLSCCIMVIFLCVCCVVLLSILIAQLSDTYHNVQRDAQRGLELNRSWIITRVDMNSIYFGKSSRLKTYTEYEDIRKLGGVLRRWKAPEMSLMNQNIRSIWENIDINRMSLMTIQERLARQEHNLLRIQESLDKLLELKTSV